MKKSLSLVLVLFLLAIPTLAQDALDATYTLDTGTRIDYPGTWDAELVDELVIISRSDSQQIIIIDYPLLTDFAQIGADTPRTVLEVFVRDIAEIGFDQDALSSFDIQAREAVRYDVPTNNGLASSIFAVRFSNEAIGMVLFFGVPDVTIAAMMDSFNNEEPASETATVRTGDFVAQRDGVYFFSEGAGRFAYPAGWRLSADLSGDIEYATLTAPDQGFRAVVADLTPVVTRDTATAEVLDVTNLNFETTFGLDLVRGMGEVIQIGDHSGVRYDARVMQDGYETAAEVIVVRYSEGGFGLLIAYGDLDAYADVQTALLGSLNNKFYGLRHIN